MTEALTTPELPFGRGADVWVVATQTDYHSRFYIDWLTNFQISRFHAGKRLEVPQELHAISAKHGVPMDAPPPELENPLMISTFTNLPNRQVVAIPYFSDQQWIDAIKRVWSQLMSPTLRVFLPEPLTIHRAQQLWKPNPDQVQWIQDASCAETPT